MTLSRAVLLAVATAAFLGPATAAASSIYDHRVITRRALLDAGWTREGDIDRVVTCNMATDFGRVNPVARTLSRIAFPGSGFQIDGVRALGRTAPFSTGGGTRGFHFNSLYTYAAIESRWRELAAWADHVCDSLARAGLTSDEERAGRLRLIGMASHAVQDFYAHSNWVRLLGPFTSGAMKAEEFPLWDELTGNDGAWRARHPAFPSSRAVEQLRESDRARSGSDDKGGLQTGRVRGEKVAGVAPWKHRHPGGAEKAVVHDLARRATILWVRRIEQRFFVELPPGQGRK